MEGDVEVDPDQDPLPLEIGRSPRSGSRARSVTGSGPYQQGQVDKSVRYPHSSSYQPSTFTSESASSIGCTMVRPAFNVHDAEVPTMSLETRGSSV